MARIRVEQAVKMVTDCLQELFYVTDGELTAKTLDPYWLTPNDVKMAMQAQYGVCIPEREYTNWNEFINVMARAVAKFY